MNKEDKYDTFIILLVIGLLVFLILIESGRADVVLRWNSLVSTMKQWVYTSDAMIPHLVIVQEWLKTRQPHTINVQALQALDEAIFYTEKLEDETEDMVRKMKLLRRQLKEGM